MLKTLKDILLLFIKLHKPIVSKNKSLKNIHKGETCFIIGNGGSLKLYDISQIPLNTSIVCGYNLLDKRMDKLNIKYFVTTDSYSLYSILFNTYPFIRRFQKNKIRPMFKEMFKKNPDLKIFVNITNIYSTLCRRKNIHFYHYFNDKKSFKHDLAGSFSNCRAALDTMLGVAKYMGFSKAVLIGCDYLGTPPLMGHVYADVEPFSDPDVDLLYYRKRVKLAADGIDVTVILPDGIISPDFDYDSYENYFKLKKCSLKNTDFISEEHIKMLRDASRVSQTIM